MQVGAGSTIRAGTVIADDDIREDVVIGRRAQVEKGALVLNGARVAEGEQVPACAIRSGYSGAQRQTRTEDGLPGVHVTARLDRTAHIQRAHGSGSAPLSGRTRRSGPTARSGRTPEWAPRRWAAG